MIAGAEIPMPASLGNHAAAVKKPWHILEQPVANSVGNAHVGAAHVAHRRKAALQAAVEEDCRKMRKVRDRRLRQARQVQAGGVNVHVSVDQPRHQHAAGAVNHLVGGADRNLALRNVLNASAGNHHVRIFNEFGGVAIENPCVAEDGAFPCCLGRHFSSPAAMVSPAHSSVTNVARAANLQPQLSSALRLKHPCAT